MRNREQQQGKQIDALGILAICIVIAIIVGCVIAQIKVFKATGWQLLPRETVAVDARQVESSSLRPGGDVAQGIHEGDTVRLADSRR